MDKIITTKYNQGENMKKAALVIVIITLISKVFGFLREIILSYYYGANNISDAYLIAYTIPGFIFSLTGIGLSTSFIPMYSLIERKNGVKSADQFTSNLLVMVAIIIAILTLVMQVFLTPTVKLFALGFDNETLQLATEFTRISLFGVFFSVTFHLFSGYLNLKGNYHIPAIAGIPNNIVVIVSIWLSVSYGITFLPIGIVASMATQLLLVYVYVIKYKFKFKPNKILKDKNIKKIVVLSLPVILGVSVNQLNVLVDRSIASIVSTGGISALNYANRLNTFVQGIFVTSIVTVMYPLLSKLVADGEENNVKKILSQMVTSINLLIVPISIGTMIYSDQIVELVFGRGEFNSIAAEMTSSALYFYSLGMLGFGLQEVLSRVFYSYQDTKTPMINATIGVVINIILNLTLSEFLGIGGLAFATSISAIITSILLFISLRKKIGALGFKEMSTSFLKIIVASIIMGAISKIIFNLLIGMTSITYSFLISVSFGIVLYFLIISFMKIKDVDIVVSLIKKNITNLRK